jgi:hypothetical protein
MSIVTVHSAFPSHAPLQPPKSVALGSGVAVRVTSANVAVRGYEPVQVSLAQVKPDAATVPAPLLVTVRVTKSRPVPVSSDVTVLVVPARTLKVPVRVPNVLGTKSIWTTHVLPPASEVALQVSASPTAKSPVTLTLIGGAVAWPMFEIENVYEATLATSTVPKSWLGSVVRFAVTIVASSLPVTRPCSGTSKIDVQAALQSQIDSATHLLSMFASLMIRTLL